MAAVAMNYHFGFGVFSRSARTRPYEKVESKDFGKRLSERGRPRLRSDRAGGH